MLLSHPRFWRTATRGRRPLCLLKRFGPCVTRSPASVSIWSLHFRDWLASGIGSLIVSYNYSKYSAISARFCKASLPLLPRKTFFLGTDRPSKGARSSLLAACFNREYLPEPKHRIFRKPLWQIGRPNSTCFRRGQSAGTFNKLITWGHTHTLQLLIVTSH